MYTNFCDIKSIEYIVNSYIKSIDNIVGVIAWLVHEYVIAIHVFPFIFIILIFTGIYSSLSFSIRLLGGKCYGKLKDDDTYKSYVNRKWKVNIKIIYWCCFVGSLWTTPIFLHWSLLHDVMLYLLAAIVFSWILGSIILAIALFQLGRSFSNAYMLLAILSLYISYWNLCLWAWRILYDFYTWLLKA